MKCKLKLSRRSLKIWKEAGQSDPLKKREEFAINLRKKKKEEIMRGKRRKLQDQIHLQNGSLANKDENEITELYKDCPIFEFENTVGCNCSMPEEFSFHQQKKTLFNEIIIRFVPSVMDNEYLTKNFNGD